jgi:hypothetical protein
MPATADAPLAVALEPRGQARKVTGKQGRLSDSDSNLRFGALPEHNQVVRLRRVTPTRGTHALGAGDAARLATPETERGVGSSGEETSDTAGQASEDRPRTRAAGTPLGSGDLFAILWHALADVLGTAAAAALLRRAAQRAQASTPELGELVITRGALEYQHELPPSWRDATLEPRPALRALVRELWPLLVDLTGSIVVQRLARIPELQAAGIIAELGAQP